MPVSLCASCGLNNPNEVELCPHHHAFDDSRDWATANRLMCDLLHRHIVPRRLTEAERDDPLDTEGSVLLQITQASEV